MDPRETKLINCLIVPSTTVRWGSLGVPLFEQTPEHGVQCRLDGYAIVPREDYEKLVAEVTWNRRADD